MDSSRKVTMQAAFLNMITHISGNPAVSVILCALLPQCWEKCPAALAWLLAWISKRLSWQSSYYHRRIEFKSGVGSTEAEEASLEKNNILQKAIRLYINRCINGPLIQDAAIYLMSSQSGVAKPVGYNPRNFGDVNAGLKMLQRYTVVRGPREGVWQLVDSVRQIQFRHQSKETIVSAQSQGIKNPFMRGAEDVSSASKVSTTFELRCNTKDAPTSLDDFIDEALNYYKDLKSASTDKTRYFFMPINKPKPSSFDYDDDCCGKGFGKGYGKGGSSPQIYRKFELSEHKNFDSLFFADKDKVMSMLDDFVNLRGKFAITGYPNKLGLLLHGPPGTGKTSLIKSIAHYTKRHIVEVPLSKVKSNQELFDSMFGLRFVVPGDDDVLKLTFKDVVFVMEDVDAVSDVVCHRTQKPAANITGKGKGKGKCYTSQQGGKACTSDRHDGDSDDTSSGSCSSGVEVITIGSDVSTADNAVADKEESHEGEGQTALSVSEGIAQLVGAFGKFGKNQKDVDVDALNLSGLLNVLDGVVDTPGRIIVMTSNHPEKLDPALIRPGRINLSVELTYMTGPSLTGLIQHLMQQALSEHQLQLVDHIVQIACVTPAQVEQLCAETDNVDQLLDKLQQVTHSHSVTLPLAIS